MEDEYGDELLRESTPHIHLEKGLTASVCSCQLCQLCIPYMKEKKWGRIILTSSVAACKFISQSEAALH